MTVDGDFGLLADSGKTSYDSVTVKTNDRAFYVPSDSMMAAAAPDSPVVSEPVPTEAQLQLLLEAASVQWTNALGAGDPRLAALSDVEISSADLGGLALGSSAGFTILVDTDAAGYGWFVDLSPADSTEFRIRLDDDVLAAAPSSEAFGRMDLLTVVAHELGHALGLDHDDAVTYTVMDHDLEASVRYLLTPSAVLPTPAGGSSGPVGSNGSNAAPAIMPAFDLDCVPAVGASPSIDWQGNAADGWKVKLSPYGLDKPANSASPNFASFLAQVLGKDRGGAPGAGYDSLGNELFGAKNGKGR